MKKLLIWKAFLLNMSYILFVYEYYFPIKTLTKIFTETFCRWPIRRFYILTFAYVYIIYPYIYMLLLTCTPLLCMYNIYPCPYIYTRSNRFNIILIVLLVTVYKPPGPPRNSQHNLTEINATVISGLNLPKFINIFAI